MSLLQEDNNKFKKKVRRIYLKYNLIHKARNKQKKYYQKQ